MKKFNIQLDTGKSGLVWAGQVGASDYNAYSVIIKLLHNNEWLDFASLSDAAIHCETSAGTKTSYRIGTGHLSVADGALVFNVPSSIISKTGNVMMQLQIFTDDSRLTVLNKFVLEVKDILEGAEAGADEEFKPLADEIYSALNRKLDKQQGGTVSGSVNFTGGLYVNGAAVPVAMTLSELEAILQ